MNKSERFNYLLEQYLSEKISLKEHDEFFKLLGTEEFDQAIARNIEHDLHDGFENLYTDLPPHIAEEIIRNIHKSEKDVSRILPKKRSQFFSWKWAAAASVVLIVFSIYFFLLRNDPLDHNQFASINPVTLVKENKSGLPMTVVLSDGSTVILESNSTLHYVKNFEEGREVFLEGSAFFDVIKDPGKPFLVYYDDIITKVLGTSFSIQKNIETGNPEVSVKTGRVQVSENKELSGNQNAGNSVIVTPNQKAIYIAKDGVLKTTLVDIPEPVKEAHNLAAKVTPRTFIYDQQSLGNIFKQFEDLFGIEISVENTNLNKCVFSGDISDLNLFEKLKIICVTINADYEVKGTKILITGKGCH
ncbi:MAG: FecR domain-containing protein [Ginsengibacter sp.]